MWKRLAVAAVILCLSPAALAQSADKTAYDRACLENYLDRYLDAMMANDPSLELFVRGCNFMENGVRLLLGGAGFWYSRSKRRMYKFYIADSRI